MGEPAGNFESLIFPTAISLLIYSRSCHGPSLDDDKAPATGHGSSLDDKAPVTTPATTPAATSIAKLPTVAIGKHDLSFESHSMQDLNALADAELL